MQTEFHKLMQDCFQTDNPLTSDYAVKKMERHFGRGVVVASAQRQKIWLARLPLERCGDQRDIKSTINAPRFSTRPGACGRLQRHLRDG